MIKTSTTLLFLILSLFVKAQIVNIPDANFKEELIKYHSIDTNGDDEISVSEAEAYTGIIDVHANNIFNLTGIEYFKNITELDCSLNKLTRLDLSHNTAITVVKCSFNKLENLNLINNTLVKKIDCYSNYLKNLNISNNIELDYLNCALNNLSNLDVSKNIKLTSLLCFHNQLSHIDLTNNINIISFCCGNNQLSNIDLTNNTNLTDLECGHNLLSSINVSKNSELKDLDCKSNLLSSIDVSKNSGLKDLDCYNNYLSSIDVSNNTELFYLRLDYNKIPFSELLKVKKQFSKLRIYYSGYIFSMISKTVGDQINYSSESSIDGKNTSFEWYLKNNDNENIVNENYVKEESKGVFTFLKTGKFFCKMTNETFPELTLRTDYVNVFNDAILDIPDPNFKEKLIENTMINLDGDNEITELEAGQYMGPLDVSNQNISDLTGIEGFLHIINLNCSGNQVQELDLSNTFSLKKFDCSNNRIDTLTFPYSKSLNNFNCSHNNLRHINFSSYKNLTKLDCSYNKLKKLSIIDTPSIIEVNCSNNEIERIRISVDCPYLKKIDFNSNHLNFYNLSLIKITDADLVKITKEHADDICLQYPPIPEVHTYINTVIDYYTERGFEGKATKFRWIDYETSSDVDENTVTESSRGIFKFIKEGKFYCEMTNEAFPDIVVYSSVVVASLKKQQTISIENIPEVVSMYDVVELNATASSGLEVNIEVIEGDVTVKGNSITFNKEETVIIKAIQKGNDEYAPAEKMIEITVDFATGIEDILDSSTQIYPNPVETEMVIKFEGSKERTIQIFDLQGKLKLQKETSSNSERISLSNFKIGMYLMKVQAKNETFTYKIIKK